MDEPKKAYWDQVESILSMDGVVEVEWQYPLIVTIHKNIQDQVRAVLTQNGYNGEIVFKDFPDDLDAVIEHQAKHLNNFDLYLMPSSHRPDLGNFPKTPGWDSERPLWNAVDEVMAEHGVTTQKVRELRELATMRTDSWDPYDDPEYRDMVVPLYRALRKRGFSDRALTG